jgi:hypothetical protein
MRKQTRRFGFKGGIHFCLMRYTHAQDMKNFVKAMLWNKEREEK